jgi:hypothetical protein
VSLTVLRVGTHKKEQIYDTYFLLMRTVLQ